MHLVPPVLSDVLLDSHMDLDRLWRLNIDACEVPIAEVDWHLNLPLWAHEGRPFAHQPGRRS
jgi:hypothetical protein